MKCTTVAAQPSTPETDNIIVFPGGRPLGTIAEEESPPYDGQPRRREPFVMIPKTVFDLTDGTALAVYAVLARHIDKEGVCWDGRCF